MRKSTYMIAAMLLASGIMVDGNVANANESTDSFMVNITAAIDKYVEENSNNLNTEDEDGSYIIGTKDEKTNEDIIIKYPEFVGVLIPKAEEYLNIRSEASEESEIIGKLYIGSSAAIIEEGEEWTKIESGSVVGYVKNEYTMRGDEAGEYAEAILPKIATVTTETLLVRQEESTESTCVGLVSEGKTYKVLDTTEEWVKIEAEDEVVGYVSAEYVDIDFKLENAISKEEEEALIKQAEEEAAKEKKKSEENKNKENKNKEKSSSKKESSATNDNEAVPEDTQQPVSIGESGGSGRSDIVDYALQFVGNPYVYGGTSLTDGTDCSGFVMSVYANFGYSLPRTSADQSNYGTEVSLDSLQPGDLLFYKGSSGRISHVTMYIGNGQVVHASTERTGIIISSVSYRTPCWARRVAN